MDPEVEGLADSLDWRAVQMLKTIDSRGEATTTSIRESTGMDNSQVRYRREKLVEHDLIDVYDGEPAGERTPPKMHALTETGQEVIDAGLYSAIQTHDVGSFDELVSRVEYLADELEEQREAIDDVRAEVSSLRRSFEHRVKDENVGERLEELENETERLNEKKKNKGIL